GQHGGEVPGSEVPLHDRESQCGIRGGDALAQKLHLLASLQETRQTVLDFLLRLQHRVLVIDQKPLQLFVLHPDGIGDLAVIEDVPLKRGAERESGPLPLEYLAELVAVDAAGGGSEGAEQAEGGVEVGFGDADLRALRRSRQLGCTDVGPAANEISRNTDDDISRWNRYPGRSSEQIVEWLRRHAKQHPQRVQPLLQLDPQLWDRRFCRAENVLCLVDVELGGGSAVIFRLSDRECLPLLDDVFLRDLDLCFERSNADISRRDIAEQGYEDLVVTGDRREVGGIGRLDAATKPAPKIQFPVYREA